MIHPTDQIIERFAQGRLPLGEAARWEQHFVSCAECGLKLGRVGSDSFMELLQQSSVVDEAPSTAIMPVQFTELPLEMRQHSRYTIQKKLGHGGMGMVYHALHRLMNRPVALKMIRSDLLATPLAVTRFRREVQAAAQLVHPNIVTAFDAEEVSGVHFLVMEYVEGKSLERLVKQKGVLSVSHVCSIAKQIAQGLHHAHSLGMIHRDIKPSNVMITRQGKVKILDFGLARWSGRSDEKALPSITRAGSHLGTMMYAAPEQRKSAGDVDVRADLYSLGATMVFLLTGEPPPIQQEDAPPVELSLPETVPAELRTILQRLLMPQPAERYPSAKAVVEALAAISSSNSIAPVASASTSSLRYALLGATVMVVVLMGVVFELGWRQRKVEPSQVSLLQEPAIVPSATKPVAEKAPAKSPKVVEGPWQSLLALILPERDAIVGRWNLRPQGLSAGPVASDGSRLAIPVKVPVEYDLRISFTRLTGKHSVGVVLVHGGKQCAFELDAWEKHLAGFQNVNEQTIESNPTRQVGYRLENNRVYHLLIEVRLGSMRAVLDGKEVSKYVGDGQNLSVDKRFWKMREGSTLGLLNWGGTVVFHSVEMREVN